MPTSTNPRRRLGAGILALVSALALALTIPIPSLPDAGRATVRDEVAERLPGWTIERVDPSWEGAYTVVTRCAGLEVDFQYVPGHGLPSRDAWLHPSDPYARARLGDLSDSRRYLVWREEPRGARVLSCPEQLARHSGGDLPERPLD
jgi:hypothetical protein